MYILQKIRKIILQIINKVINNHEKARVHLQNIMRTCTKVIETDNEQCALCSVLIIKELINLFKPKYDSICLKAEVY